MVKKLEMGRIVACMKLHQGKKFLEKPRNNERTWARMKLTIQVFVLIVLTMSPWPPRIEKWDETGVALDARRKAIWLLHVRTWRIKILHCQRWQSTKMKKKQMSCKIEWSIFYRWQEKGRLFKACPMGKIPKPSMSIHSHSLRKPTTNTCARKMIGSPRFRTNIIWVPRALLTNIDGPISRWVPKHAN